MTITDTESIWSTVLNPTRFGKIGTRIAEVLNFLVHGDATTNVTDAGCLPILEQISEEILFDLIAAAKGSDSVVPWVFIQANVSKMNWKYYDNHLIRKIKEKITGNVKVISGEWKTRNLNFGRDLNDKI